MQGDVLERTLGQELEVEMDLILLSWEKGIGYVPGNDTDSR
jgi:hypothetical protein